MHTKTTKGRGTAKPVVKSPVKPDKKEESIPITVRITPATADRLIKYMKQKGHLTEQEVIRLAIAVFLEKSGY